MQKSNINQHNDAITFPEHGEILKIDKIFAVAKIPNIEIGKLCYIIKSNNAKVSAEVIAVEKDIAKLILLDSPDGCKIGDKIIKSEKPIGFAIGDFLVGKIIDESANVIYGKDFDVENTKYISATTTSIPFVKRNINKIFQTGIKSIDGFLTVGYGQKMLMLYNNGSGASTLQGMIIKNSPADINIIALVGKSNREIQDWIEYYLDEEIMEKTIVIATNSTGTPYKKIKCVEFATMLCEYYRNQGKNVLFLSDGILDAADAYNEISAANSNKFEKDKYSNSTITWINNIIEKCYSTNSGTITSFFSVYINKNINEDNLIINTVKNLTDGHIFLNSKIGEAYIYPTIDILCSVSRYMQNLVDEKHFIEAKKLRRIFEAFCNMGCLETNYHHIFKENEEADFIYTKGQSICELLKQRINENPSYNNTRNILISILSS